MNRMIPNAVGWLLNPPDTAPPATILIRVMAGGVWVWEGVLKFVFPNTLGVGRFAKIGIPAPEGMATFVAGVEIVCGTLLLLGLLTRLASIPLIVDISVAILSTKISLLLGTSPLPAPPVPPQSGIWAVLHESRSDYAQLLTTLFLLLVGSGPWALDAFLSRSAARGDTRRTPAMGVGD